ncbi:MAG: hypothetical protein II857_06670 [Selenomonadaceae bacterium]|nr:hypothetical protein [Selenomonadaceae bacterium]
MTCKEQLKSTVKSIAQDLENTVAGVDFDEVDNRDGEFNFGEEYDRLRWYFEDVLDVKFTIDARFNYCGAEIALGLGGPNIYYDTAQGRVHGYWDGQEEYFVDHDTRNAIDEYWEEEFNLLRESY